MNNSALTHPEDQTQFADQAVLFQDQQQPTQPALESDKKPTKSRKLIGIGIVLLIVIFLLLLLALVASNRNGQQTPQASPEPFDLDRQRSPIQTRIDEARLDLELADPGDQLLPFPQVATEIRIIDKKR